MIEHIKKQIHLYLKYIGCLYVKCYESLQNDNVSTSLKYKVVCYKIMFVLRNILIRITVMLQRYPSVNITQDTFYLILLLT